MATHDEDRNETYLTRDEEAELLEAELARLDPDVRDDEDDNEEEA